MDLAAGGRRCRHWQPFKHQYRQAPPSLKVHAKYRRAAHRSANSRLRPRRELRSADDFQDEYVEDDKAEQSAEVVAGTAADKQATARQPHANELPAGANLLAQQQLMLQHRYASRNEDIVQALKMLGRDVKLEQPGPTSADSAADQLLGEDSSVTGYLNDTEHVEDDASDSFDGVSGDPAAQASWIGDAGWQVRTSPSGDVFLERDVRAKPKRPAVLKSSSTSSTPQSLAGGSQQSSPPLPPTAAAAPKVPSAATAAAAAAAAAADKTLEGDTQQPAGVKASPRVQPSSRPAPGGAAQRVVAGAGGSVASSSSGAQPLPCVLQPPQLLHPGLKPALRTLRMPEQLLDFACLLYPIWAAAGCRLAAPAVLAAPHNVAATEPGAPKLGVAPTPIDAAIVLQAVALAVKREGWSQARRLELCRDARIVGLMEALRVKPPRLSPDQQASPTLCKALMSMFSTAARKWWLSALKITASSSNTGGAAGASDAAGAGNGTGLNGFHMPQISRLNGHTPSSTPAGSMTLQPPTGSSSSSSGSGGGVHQQSGGDSDGDGQSSRSIPASAGQEYTQILSKYLNGSPDGDEAKAVRSARHQAVVASLWAMAALGGPSCWQEEMEAVLRVAGGGATDWRSCGPGDAGSVAWALATSRHYSSQLSKLATALGQDIGGSSIWHMAPDEITRLLWGYATLNHPLTGLPLPDDWAWQQGTRGGDVRDFSAVQLAGCCWALAVHGATQHPAFTSAWHALLSRPAEVAAAGPVVLTQVWQVALELKLRGLEATAPQASAQEGHNITHAATVSKKASIDLVVQIIDAALHTWKQQHAATQHTRQSTVAVRPDQHALGQHVAQNTVPAARSKAMQAAEALLQAAAKAFMQSSRAVRGAQAGKGLGSTSGASTHSSYQRQMGNALVALRHMHVVEDVTTGYAVDLSLPLLKVAIEADGPSHFSRVPSPKLIHASAAPAASNSSTVRQRTSEKTLWPLGATAMKRRHLKALGWALVSISTEEWDMAGSPAVQQALLKQRIEAAVQDRLEFVLSRAA